MFEQFKRIFTRRTLIASLSVILVFINLAYLLNLYAIFEQDKNNPIPEPGYEFAGLKTKLSTVEAAGFLTDKDMSAENNDGKFLEAQYVLAPIILELGNSEHPFIIVDSQNLLNGFALLEGIKAAPVLVTPYGKILAQKGI